MQPAASGSNRSVRPTATGRPRSPEGREVGSSLSDLRLEEVSALVHALKEPLQGIVGLTDLLLLGRFGSLDAAQRSTIARIEARAEELRYGIDAVAALLAVHSAADDGAAPEPIELAPLVEAALRRLERDADASACGLSSALPEDLPPIAGQRSTLMRVLQALLRQAITGGRHVCVRAHANEPDVAAGARIEIVMEGPGDRDPPGGAFLPIYRLIMAAQKGELWSEPRQDGGAAIVLTLPFFEEGS